MINLPFAVRHNRIWSVSMLIISVLSLIMGFWQMEMLEIFMGFVLLILGFFFYKNPIMVVFNTEIELRNAFGMTLRKTNYQTQHIRFEGYKLFVNNQRWPISALIAQKSDLQKLKVYFKNLQKNSLK